uniref:Secreted protein n=1 Tax=Rhabditophanes sp. KR3021 TaxID=114890 RepID=A0AC35UBR7_9BILA
MMAYKAVKFKNLFYLFCVYALFREPFLVHGGEVVEDGVDRVSLRPNFSGSSLLNNMEEAINFTDFHTDEDISFADDGDGS